MAFVHVGHKKAWVGKLAPSLVVEDVEGKDADAISQLFSARRTKESYWTSKKTYFLALLFIQTLRTPISLGHLWE